VSVELIRYSERPELWSGTAEITAEVWPEYSRNADATGPLWGRLFEDFPAYQFCLYDEREQEVLAERHTAPCQWDGTPDGLGDGFDSMLVGAFAARQAGRRPNALCALAAEIRPRFQGRGLADRVLDGMAELARQAGLRHLLAPVRPSFKDRYPISPIRRYATWKRADGEPLDPWIRVHVRRGGTIVRPAPRSMRTTGTVAEWEAWTGMRFPDDGAYVFPRGLAPVEIDHSRDIGA